MASFSWRSCGTAPRVTASWAISIMGGLIVATALTLVFVPALYAAWFRIRRESPAQARDAGPIEAPAAPAGH